MTEAIYNASKGKEQAKEIAADPLIVNGQKLYFGGPWVQVDGATGSGGAVADPSSNADRLSTNLSKLSAFNNAFSR